MRIYLMTDLEGVAGVLNFEEWTSPGKFHYLTARELLTQEVNGAVDGFFAGGATSVLVVDAHGPCGVNIKELDSRADLSRGWPDETWPLGVDAGFDAVAWVGQHAKACTPYGHLCHTQSLDYTDETVNGISIGEFGELAMCASEVGVRAIFGSGDEAFTKEAQALVPGIETVAVKQGLRASTGADLDVEAYSRHVGSARHTHPVRAREAIRAGAQRAVERAKKESFGIIPLTAPFTRVVKLRRGPRRAYATVMKVTHPSSFIGVMRKWSKEKPVAG
jgi:D-amino peptidase